MRFKVDENLPIEVAEMLIGAGHDDSFVSLAGKPTAAQNCGNIAYW